MGKTNQIKQAVKKSEGISNSKQRKLEAQAHNETTTLINNMMPIGYCHNCGEMIFMYLKSNPENICNYYCVGCEHKSTIKNPEKKDKFLFPMRDIVDEVAKHYDPDVFDKAYNS